MIDSAERTMPALFAIQGAGAQVTTNGNWTPVNKLFCLSLDKIDVSPLLQPHVDPLVSIAKRQACCLQVPPLNVSIANLTGYT